MSALLRVAEAVKSILVVLGCIAIAVLGALALYVLWRVVWLVLSQPAASTGEMAAQSELLVGFGSLLLTAALVGTTMYYARQTRRLVDEARAEREDERAARAAEDRAARMQRVEGATSALLGACSDMLAIGTPLAVLVRRRRVWRMSRVQAATQPLVAAGRALDQLRYLAPDSVTQAAEQVFDRILEFFQAASAGAEQDRLETISRRMHAAKHQLQQEVANTKEAKA